MNTGRNQKHKYSGTKQFGICFYPVLPNWSVRSSSSVFFCVSGLFHHGTNVEFISHVRLSCYGWSGYGMSLVKNNLVNSFSAQSHVTSNPSCIWISATCKNPHLEWLLLTLMVLVLLWSQMSHKRLIQLLEFTSHKNSHNDVLSQWL